jgi:phenylalanyl-tRNA synthetase alpha chain
MSISPPAPDPSTSGSPQPGLLAELEAHAEAAFAATATEEALLHAKGAFLGKAGRLAAALARMKDLPPAERPAWGKAVNAAKDGIEARLEFHLDRLRTERRLRDLEGPRVDLTLPGRKPAPGAIHPLRLVERDMLRVFRDMGFDVALGPEVETDFHNFEALNFPPDHPARDMQDTFLLRDGRLLRTHTSPVQIRTMLANEPPIRIAAPGAVYRCDTLDQTHSPNFRQVEGLVVDRNITMADLKGTLLRFSRGLFKKDVEIRLRPSFFPFTEPSVEVDVQCVFCGGTGCRVCKHSGWIEILGAGMVDPEVFSSVGYDPDVLTGFAFGIGVERVAMLVYGIDDIRHFYENDVRFLSQFV